MKDAYPFDVLFPARFELLLSAAFAILLADAIDSYEISVFSQRLGAD